MTNCLIRPDQHVPHAHRGGGGHLSQSQAMLALKHIASQLPGLRALHQQNWEDVVCNTIADVKYEEVEEVLREGKGIRRVKVRFPAAGSADMVTHGCDVIGIVAQEEARREQIAAGCADVVVEAMQLFPNDALVQMAAVRALYNMCYRCEPGHRAVNKAEPEAPLHRILDRFSADFELAQVCFVAPWVRGTCCWLQPISWFFVSCGTCSSSLGGRCWQ